MKTTNLILQNPTPLVSVLITNYNYGKFLTEAIDSVLNQSWKKIEVIVVDDGSTDESHEVLEQYKGQIHTVFKKNGGQASAFNVGIAEAKGEIICFLDADDIWHPDKVSRVVDIFKEAPCSLVHHHLTNFNHLEGSEKQVDVTHGPLHSTISTRGNVIEKLGAIGYGWVFQPTSAISVKADVAKKLIPFDEKDWRICADNPLTYGAACLGPVQFIQDRLGFYRIHDQNGFARADKATLAYSTKNLLINIKRYIYVVDFLGKNDKNVRYDLDFYYPGFRRRVFAFSKSPLSHLPKLITANISYFSDQHTGSVSKFCLMIMWMVTDVLKTFLFVTILRKKHSSKVEYSRGISYKEGDELQKFILRY